MENKTFDNIPEFIKSFEKGLREYYNNPKNNSNEFLFTLNTPFGNYLLVVPCFFKNPTNIYEEVHNLKINIKNSLAENNIDLFKKYDDELYELIKSSDDMLLTNSILREYEKEIETQIKLNTSESFKRAAILKNRINTLNIVDKL